MIAVILLCVGFKTAASLSYAYGMAVSLTMLVTSTLTILHGRTLVKAGWRFQLVPLAIFMLGATAIDILLVSSCAIKFVNGAWLPLAAGFILFILMSTWKRGSTLMQAAIRTQQPPLEPFIAWLSEQKIYATERPAVYAVSDSDVVPMAMLQNLKFYQVKHENTLILKVNFLEQPTVSEAQQIQTEKLAVGIWRIVVNYGYKDHPDVPGVVARLECRGMPIKADHVTYILCRHKVTSSPKSTMLPFLSDMGLWRKYIFALMHRNASSAVDYYCLPVESTAEVAAYVTI